MKQLLNNPLLLLLIRLAVGIFFLLASIGKIADPSLFAREIANYRLLPDILVNIFAITLPWIEAASAIFLITGIRLKTNSAIISSLLVVFIVALLSAMARGLNINCGCIANQVTMVGWNKVFEDAALLLGALIVFFSNNQSLTLEKVIIDNYKLSEKAPY